ASMEQWGATLEIINTGKEIKLSEPWSPRWRLASSNQMETASIYLALCRMEKELISFKISSLRIQSDNSSAMFNLNRGAAAPALASLKNMILEKVEQMQIQISMFHIPDKSNQVADALSRQSASGDYEIRQEILEEALRCLDVRPTVDVFANRRNRKCKSTTLVACVPKCSSQPSSCGKCADVQVPGGRMIKQRRHLPLGDLLVAKFKGEKGEDTFFELPRLRGLSDDAIHSSVEGWHTAWRRHRQRIGQFIDYWKGIRGSFQDQITHKDPEAEVINYVMHLKQNKASANNIIESVTVLSLLFKVSGHSVLRLADVMRSEAIKGDNGVWQLSTATWKGGDDGVVVTFRKSKHKNTSPSFWLAAWINGNQKRTKSENLWYLIKTKRVASVEYGSKAVLEIMKLAGIEMTYSVTSIRAQSITQQVKIGATKKIGNLQKTQSHQQKRALDGCGLSKQSRNKNHSNDKEDETHHGFLSNFIHEHEHGHRRNQKRKNHSDESNDQAEQTQESDDDNMDEDGVKKLSAKEQQQLGYVRNKIDDDVWEKKLEQQINELQADYNKISSVVEKKYYFHMTIGIVIIFVVFMTQLILLVAFVENYSLAPSNILLSGMRPPTLSRILLYILQII
ncbi:MAG: hypothetical protein EZS28_020248, partial [Streblomastix strix]